MTKTRALRHGPRFATQLDGLHQMDVIADARAAVANAALAAWHEGWQGEAQHVLHAACAALEILEQNANPSAITCVHGTSETLCEQCWPRKVNP
jgi:hypothetical protein